MEFLVTLGETFLITFLYDWLSLKSEEKKRRLINIVERSAEETSVICAKEKGIEVDSKDIIKALKVSKDETPVDFQADLNTDQAVKAFLSLSEFYIPEEQVKIKQASAIFEVFAKVTLYEIFDDHVLANSLAHKERTDIKELLEENRGELETIKKGIEELKAESGKADAKEKVPDKKHYSQPENYIPRSVTPISEVTKYHQYLFKRKGRDLTKEILNNHKIVLLADAGSGKTFELARIASYFSDETGSYYPIKISLKNYIDQKIESYIKEYQSLPSRNLVLLIDGLDELLPNERHQFYKRLHGFLEEYPNAKVILSCRTNLYEFGDDQIASELEAFHTYYLNDLTSEQISDYLSAEINNPDKLIQRLNKIDLYDLLYNPFYLANITLLFKETGSLPQNRVELFEGLFESRMNRDFEKIRSELTDLTNPQIKSYVWKLNERLAFILELLGRNEFLIEELEKIFSDRDINILKRFGSIVKDSSSEFEAWKFEHRQIQEYLAARVLSKLKFEEIQEVIAFPPNYERLKPTWYNTVGLLFSMLNRNSGAFYKLTEWLKQGNEKVFLYLERDRISPGLKKAILSQFIEIAEERGIGLNLNFKESQRLAEITNNNECLYFIVDKLKSSEWDNAHLITDLISLLREFKIFDPQTREDIKSYLTEKLLSGKFNSYMNRTIVYTIKDLKLYDEKSSRQILDKYRDTDHDDLKAALFYFLIDNPYVDEELDFIISSIEDQHKSAQDRLRGDSVDLMDVPIRLEQLITSLENPSSFNKILDLFSRSPQLLNEMGASFLEKLVNQGVELYETNNSIHDKFIELLVSIRSGYIRNEGKALIKFFKESNSEVSAFKKIIENYGVEDIRIWDLISLYSQELEDFVVQKYSEGKINSDFIKWFIHHLSNEKLSQSLRKKIENKTKDVIETPQTTDWEKIRKKQKEEDLEVLFDRQRFISELEAVFDKYDNVVEEEAISDERYKQEGNLEFPAIVLDLISEFIRSNETGSVQRNEVFEWLEREDWDYFVICKFYARQISGRSDIEKLIEELADLDKIKIEFIHDWSKKQVQNFDYRNALNTNEEGLSRTPYKALYPWLFMRLFGFKYDEEKVKEMIAYHSAFQFPGDEGLEYYEQFLTEDEILVEVFKNFEAGIEDRFVIVEHLKYCKDKSASEVIKYAKKFYLEESFDREIRREALDVLLSFLEGFEFVKNNIDEIEGDLRWIVIDKLLRKGADKVVVYELKKILSDSSDEQDKINAAARLIIYKEKVGLEYYLEVTENKKHIPTSNYYEKGREVPVSYWSDVSSLDILMQFLRLHYEDDFQKDDFKSVRRAVLNALSQIALQSKENKDTVIKSLSKFIESYKQEFDEVKFLYRAIDDIRERFYLNEGQSISLETAKETADKLLS